jgi:uncharacterized membrane protein YsdA (DUF1294 family)
MEKNTVKKYLAAATLLIGIYAFAMVFKDDHSAEEWTKMIAASTLIVLSLLIGAKIHNKIKK